MARGDGAQFFEDIKATTKNILTEHQDIDEATAEQLALSLSQQLHQTWAAQLFYIPKFSAFILSQRDLDIYQEWNGRNMPYLCKKYKLSTQYIYDIIKRVRESLPKDQPDMFD